ncbi:MAG: hypothetical protein OEM91_00590, partial [Hyphomicrobiales bacterium]|nr:hypothetical protein [Hyphomicrobiales bacterium]
VDQGRRRTPVGGHILDEMVEQDLHWQSVNTLDCSQQLNPSRSPGSQIRPHQEGHTPLLHR